MFRKTIFSSLIIIFAVMNSFADTNLKDRSSGVGFRASYWSGYNDQSDYTVIHKDGRSHVDIGGGGGWLSFFSRMSENDVLELSLGALGNAETKTTYYYGEDTDVNVVAAVTLGIRHEFYSFYHNKAMVPYVTVGGGPYWVSDILVKDRDFDYDDEVLVHTKLRAGMYAGAGMNFMLSSWFGLDFDLRYHLINFDVNNDYSGWETGLGFNFYWGSFN